MLNGQIKTKKTFKDILNSKLFLIICLALIGLVSVSLVKEFMRKLEISREIDSLKQEVASLEAENYKLGDLVQYLNSSGWQEKEVKKRFNVKSPGEKVALIPENTQTSFESSLEVKDNSKPQPEEISNPRKWVNYFLTQ